MSTLVLSGKWKNSSFLFRMLRVFHCIIRIFIFMGIRIYKRGLQLPRTVVHGSYIFSNLKSVQKLDFLIRHKKTDFVLFVF